MPIPKPEPKPVIIDGDTPTDPSSLTTVEALAAMRLMVTKLPAADAPALSDGLMRLAETLGSPREWYDLLRREVARAHEVMHDRAKVYGEWQPVVSRTEAEMNADETREMRLNAIAAEHKLVTIWSVGGADDLDAPHPFPSATTLVRTTISGVEPESGEQCWGGDGGRFEAPIHGPRWLDLWVAADAAIQLSADLHHRFIEAFNPNLDHPCELNLGCGS